jgi:hypothetical protein
MSDIINGTVFVTDTRHDDALVYTTIEGNDLDRPMIIAFDRDDLDAIGAAYETLKQGPQPCGCPECGGARRFNVRHVADAGAGAFSDHATSHASERPAALDFFNTADEPDPAAVLDILNAPKGDGRFIHDRVEYRYDAQRTQWVAWGRTDIDDQDGVW